MDITDEIWLIFEVWHASSISTALGMLQFCKFNGCDTTNAGDDRMK